MTLISELFQEGPTLAGPWSLGQWWAWVFSREVKKEERGEKTLDLGRKKPDFAKAKTRKYLERTEGTRERLQKGHFLRGGRE